MLGTKHDLFLASPYLNRAGFLGFSPDPRSPGRYGDLGAFITNPISMSPRSAAATPRLLTFPGGFLLHTGHPNPGLRSVVDQHRRRWEKSPTPILVHLLAEDPGSLGEAFKILEQVEGVMGIEVGLPPGIDAGGLRDFCQAAQGELPFLLQIPARDFSTLLAASAAAGASGVTISPPRGTLPGPSGSQVSGRLYGRAALPLVLNLLHEAGSSGLPIYAGGGIETPQEAEALRAAGAAGVLLDYVLWQPGTLARFKPVSQE